MPSHVAAILMRMRFALDTILFVTRNQRPRLGKGGGGVEAQSRVHLGTYAARHDFQNL